jgi:hypothetical protein
MRSSCAIVFLFACTATAGCALDHGRVDGVVHPTPAAPDAGPVATDVGPLENCGQLWNALPYCPANAMTALGQNCENEGASCGDRCCEPGPAIACVGHRWQLSGADPDCSGVRCHGPTPCGDGACAFGRGCVMPAGELGSASPNRCVELPPSMTSCGTAPPGAIGSDGCMSCGCADPGGLIEIRVDCLCC